jgi:hypothetical protein
LKFFDSGTQYSWPQNLKRSTWMHLEIRSSYQISNCWVLFWTWKIEVDILVIVCGFHSVTGGITQIDIQWLDRGSVKEKWANGGPPTFLLENQVKIRWCR